MSQPVALLHQAELSETRNQCIAAARNTEIQGYQAPESAHGPGPSTRFLSERLPSRGRERNGIAHDITARNVLIPNSRYGLEPGESMR